MSGVLVTDRRVRLYQGRVATPGCPGCCGAATPCCVDGRLCVLQNVEPGAVGNYAVTIAYTHVVRNVNASGVFVTTTTATGTHLLSGTCVFLQNSVPGLITAEPIGGAPFTNPTTCAVGWQARLAVGPGLTPVGPNPIPSPNVTVIAGTGGAEFFATTNNASFAHWQIGFGPGRYVYSWKPPDVGTSGMGTIGACGASFGGQAEWDSRIAFGGGFPYSTETLAVQVVISPVAQCAATDSGCSDCDPSELTPATG